MGNKEEKDLVVTPRSSSLLFSLRGFGFRNVVLGEGTYGPELEARLRRQGRSGEAKSGVRSSEPPISDRISRAASIRRFGNYPGGGDGEVSVTISDCFAPGASRGITCAAGELEPANKEPHTISCYVSSTKQRIRLYGIPDGSELENERLEASGQLRGFREEKPELSTGSCLVDFWQWLRIEYSEIFSGS